MCSETLAIHFLSVVFLICFQNSGAAEDKDWINGLYFSQDRGNRDYVTKKCADMKMRLAVVDEKYKLDAINEHQKNNSDNWQYYIGGERITKDGLRAYNVEFRWLNGERLSYRHFGPDRPNNNLEFFTQPRSHLTLHFDLKETFFWDSDYRKVFRYICEPPRDPDVKGPPNPKNEFKIDFSHGLIKGFEKNVLRCKYMFNKCMLGLDNEELKNSLLDIFIRNDDRQPYYLNAMRKDGKSPYMWYNSTVIVDQKHWGSGTPSDKDDEKCATVWYDPKSGGLKWASSKCDLLVYIACQGEEGKCIKVDDSGANGGPKSNGTTEVTGGTAIKGGKGASCKGRKGGKGVKTGGAGASGGLGASGGAGATGNAGGNLSIGR